MRSSHADRRRTTAAILLNIGSSVGIVMVNKLVFEVHAFNFATFVTVIHFCCTWIGLVVCARLGAFEPKPVAWRRMLGLCASFCGFVVLTNLSLQYNSVGFYQMAKVLTTPAVALIQFLFYGKTFARPTIISLAVICLGVGIANVTDVQMNFVGTVYALAGVVVTSLYQVWIGSEQKALQLLPPQLLYRQAPMSALMLLPCVFLLDDVPALMRYELTFGALCSILLSGVLAFLVNWSIFAVIGRTSAITYNVVGHAKLCLIIVGGFILFSYPLDWRNLGGIFIALVGIYLYSKVKLAESAAAKSSASSASKP
ncbi:triose-phosphate transporter family-domain-containing protein [Syncephalis pseudoplumigaleata]|uniref:Triose-phosphate transporter family-domain-containing protein n=1 Tax=Syncephalis pseudoplumigaleata TaxID=1712513 RepID=A0A4P9Z4Y0_9FUNG|nr:triose-phosphate transporter family-domain-containing protein [Syncephalis pseudoplumigaleata]|eukprot:RKP27535.1 triose-phosphate transporter family-domain-containing protein [Syncephalis pseudoplumigaleata]